ncbi:MAG: hypothetical protein ACJAVK_002296 [Akkermansiaceae bacterium]|jgi:hypothetical protein
MNSAPSNSISFVATDTANNTKSAQAIISANGTDELFLNNRHCDARNSQPTK